MNDRDQPKPSVDQDPLAELLVFDCLEVGPLKLEPRRLVAPYRLQWGDRSDQTELIYSYDEAVFDPKEPESLNLASMIAAQVALNYGLFCRQLVFHGLYDTTDRRFLRQMAENTACEIYVKKFLESNPFLVGPAVQLPLVKLKSYLQARLAFPDAPGGRKKPAWKLWPSDKQRCCVLSSGGKDSLLSFGLLNELAHQCERHQVHPIFVNESGRHWFTALNAHRYFAEHVPHTGRVWVNSDRVFNWMLRRMPFIRKNFEDIRADEYPIRLWTVAVFLFGVLPLMRKRGLGRLIIGDEFDTSRRTFHKGIRHYDGLFDQSIYFDQVLSGYFLRKGWSISQFSILRPLSELLIQKTLARRYPHLLQHQVSCHAAHKQADRVHPCGKCEKCRRIVGMLVALGEDPGRCGYSPQQVEDCLKALALRGVHQEAEGAEHLQYLLSRHERTRGLFPADAHFKSQPQVLQLRFHPEWSPPDAIPVDLRKPLYRIYLEHAEGAVAYAQRRWAPCDLLAHPAMVRPYAFELDVPEVNEEPAGRAGSGRSIVWGELTWPEAEERLKQVDVALLPVGAVEQHGPHLPLDTDAFDADYLARRVAEACSDPKPLLLPLIGYGVSYHHVGFQGTLSINNDTLSRLVYDIGLSVAANGIRKLVILNGHGGNSPALNYAAQMINRDARIFVCVDTGETSDVDIHEIVETPNDVHAGEIETSTSLAVRPHLVNMAQAKRAIPRFSSHYLNFTSKRTVNWYAHTRKISASGTMGDPTRASAEKGRRIWEIMIAHLVGLVEDLKHMTLDEIHQRRY